jgi:hypothetical protein
MLDLEFLTPYSGGFIPVHFGKMNGAIHQPDTRYPLAFTPTAASIYSPQTSDFTDSGPCSKRLNVCKLAENFKSHQRIVSRLC